MKKSFSTDAMYNLVLTTELVASFMPSGLSCMQAIVSRFFHSSSRLQFLLINQLLHIFSRKERKEKVKWSAVW
jgi:hypothetical protein